MLKENNKKMMQAIRVYNFGGPEQLIHELLPIPQPETNQVLVQIHAAACKSIRLEIKGRLF